MYLYQYPVSDTLGYRRYLKNAGTNTLAKNPNIIFIIFEIK